MSRSVCWLLVTLACAGWLGSSALSTQSGDVLNLDGWDPTTVEEDGPAIRALDGSYNPGDVETEPEPEPEAEPEPEPEPESETYPDLNTTEAPALPPFAEPVPNWDKALPLYGLFWEVHIYVLGSLFALLALYSLVSLVRLRTRRLLSQGYFMALNLMMLLLGADRAVYLFVDAYNYKGIFPLSVAYMLLGLGFPCLSSAFSILFLALLQSTQTRLVSPKIQRAKVLAGIIVFHFTVSVVVDVMVGIFTSAQVLLLLCQGVFLIWGFFLSISYLVIFRRLHKSSVRQFREISRMSMSRRTSSLYGISPFMKKPRNNWGSAIKVTLFASFFGVTIGLLQLYGILVVYGPLGEKVPEPWPWVTYQFAFRLCELVMCVLMSFVATQPFRYNSKGVETPMLMCCTNLLRAVTCKTSHELQENDDYRLVSADGDPYVPGNDDIRAAQRRVIFGPTDSEIDKEAVLVNHHLPVSNTFHREVREEPAKSVSLGTQVPEIEAPGEKTNGEVVEEVKIRLDLSPGTLNGVKNNSHAPASAPVMDHQWGTGNPLACTDSGSGDAKLGNQNKNNHHSCPTTPLHGGGDPTHSDSNPLAAPSLTVTDTEVPPEKPETSGQPDAPNKMESAEVDRPDVEPASTDSTEAGESPDKPEADLRPSDSEAQYESTHF